MKATPLLAVALLSGWASVVPAKDLPEYLQDRGEGVTSSLFGTYIEEGEWKVYPFYEFEKNTDEEYKGSELGFSNDQTDYFGEKTQHQLLLFLGYGLTKDIALELEFALYEKATLNKDPNDTTSGIPNEISESGFGEVETQVRWRMRHETESRPEIFSFLEIGYPFQDNKKIIGIQDWEGGIGIGLVKGFSWGTLTPRISIEYDGADEEIEPGEYAIEYLKRLSDRTRIVTTLEGESDEVQLIGELQYRISSNGVLKLNSGFGLTKKAPDVAPEIGIMFSF